MVDIAEQRVRDTKMAMTGSAMSASYNPPWDLYAAFERSYGEAQPRTMKD